MPENISFNNLEEEILELQKKIEEKRKELEGTSGVIEEKELVRASVGEMFKDVLTPSSAATSSAAPAPAAPIKTQLASSSASYLDSLEPEAAEKLNALVEDLNQKGLRKTIKEVEDSDAYLIDAFHDLVVDRLYEELKKRNIIK